jgi:hypothetical protein
VTVKRRPRPGWVWALCARGLVGWLAAYVVRPGIFFIYFCVFSKNKYLISKLSKLAYSLCLKWRLEPTAAVKGSWH